MKNETNNNLILAEITNDIIEKLEERISNINNQIELVPKEAQGNWNGQKIGFNEAIKIVQNEFMKKINKL